MASRFPVGRLGLPVVDIASEAFAYPERLDMVDALSGAFSMLGDGAVGATTASLNLFVSVSGSDSNPGTFAQPVRTIQRAVDLVPKLVRHPTTITVDTGSYAGAVITGFTISPAVPLSGAWLIVQGSWQPTQLTAGPSSGTMTAAVAGASTFFPWGAVTASNAPGWNSNELRGHHLLVTSGTSAGQVRVVAINNPNDLTIVGGWFAPTPDSTSGFAIVDPATTITGTLSAVPGPDGITTTTGVGFLVYDNNCAIGNAVIGNEAGNIVIQNFAFSASFSAGGVTTNGCHVRRCRVDNGLSNFVNRRGGGQMVRIDDCVLTGSNTAGSLLGGDGLANASNVCVGVLAGASLSRNFVYNRLAPVFAPVSPGEIVDMGSYYVQGAAPLYEYGLGGNQTLHAFGCWFSGSTRVYGPNNAGTSNLAPSKTFVINNCRTDACSIVVDARGPGLVDVFALTGSGNTTLFSLTQGAKAQIHSNVSVMGATTELSIDGTVVTLATMRAGSPVHATGSSQAIYGTIAYQPA